MKKLLIQFSKSLIPLEGLKSIKGGYGGPQSCGICFTNDQGTRLCGNFGGDCVCPVLGASPCSSNW